eukprot:Nk52_evm4s2514 gene=Nk52_evmTU4s2514
MILTPSRQYLPDPMPPPQMLKHRRPSSIAESSSGRQKANSTTNASGGEFGETSTIAIESNYQHLLQPIRDLTKNWNIDVAAELSEYIAQIEDINFTFDGGETCLNFAEAALLIQGSACVYSKKVEYLYSLVFQTLDLIMSKRKKTCKSSINDDGLDEDADNKYGVTPAFLFLDDLKESDNIDLPGGDLGNKRKSFLNVRMPSAFMTTEKSSFGNTGAGGLDIMDKKGEVLGNRSDFRMNSSLIHSSGAIILNAAETFDMDVGAEHPEADIDMDNATGETEGGIDMDDNDNDFGGFDEGGLGDNNDFGGDDFQEAPSIQDNSNTNTHKKSVHFVPTFGVDDDKSKEDEDPWTVLDPHVDTLTSKRPFRKGKTWRLPRSILDERSDASVKTPLEPISVFCSRMNSSSIRNVSQNPLKALKYPEFEKLFCKEAKRRRDEMKETKVQLLKDIQLSQNKDPYSAQNEEEGNGEIQPWDIDGAAMDEDDDFGDQPVFGNEEGGFGGDDGDVFAGAEDAIGTDNAPAYKEVAEEYSNYEDMVRRHIDQFMTSAQTYVKQTQLAQRVQEWESRIKPILNEEAQHQSFDIRETGNLFLEKFDDKQVKRHSKMPFEKFATSKEPFEISRMFLAVLQLANEGNIEICPEKDDHLGIRILSKERRSSSQEDFY